MEEIQEIHGTISEAGIAHVVPLDVVVKMRSIDVVFPYPGQIPEADFARPFTVAVIVIVEPGWQPLIAPNVPP
jgi:hypothetical protein